MGKSRYISKSMAEWKKMYGATFIRGGGGGKHEMLPEIFAFLMRYWYRADGVSGSWVTPELVKFNSFFKQMCGP